MKVSFLNKPIYFVIIVFIGSILILAYIFRIFELPFEHLTQQDDEGNF